MCQVLSSKMVKTRKPHRCFGCTRQVPVGTHILRVVSVDQGEASSAYWCSVCDRAVSNELAAGGEACFMEGEFMESIKEAGLNLGQPVAQ